MGRVRSVLNWGVKHRLKLLVCMLLALISSVVVVGGGQLVSSFRQTENYRLQAIEVKGHHLINGGQVLAASGLDEGANIFGADLLQVAENIERLAWVKEARIERKPPDRLVVNLVERQRLAWVELDQVYGIDADGVLLPVDKDPAEATRDLDLPVITGLKIDGPIPAVGQALSDSTLSQVLGWWRLAQDSDPSFCATISEIRPGGAGYIRLFLIGDGLQVRLPVSAVEERLALLKQIVGRVYRECPNPAYIDMRFDGQVVVGSATPPQSS